MTNLKQSKKFSKEYLNLIPILTLGNVNIYRGTS